MPRSEKPTPPDPVKPNTLDHRLIASELPSGRETDLDSPPPEGANALTGYSSRSTTDLPAMWTLDEEDEALVWDM